MRIYNIPAYSYFATTSYRTDIFYVCDDALLRKYNALYDDTSFHNIWSASGLTYSSIFKKANELIGAPIFSPNHQLIQIYNNGSASTPTQWIARIISDFGVSLDAIKVTDDYTVAPVTQEHTHPTSTSALNNDVIVADEFNLGNANRNHIFSMGSDTTTSDLSFSTGLNYVDVSMTIVVYPETLFVNGVIVDQTTFEQLLPKPIKLRIRAHYTTDGADLDEMTSWSLAVANWNSRNAWLSLSRLLVNFHTANSGMTYKEFDDNNPYGTDGTSTTGGGDGTLGAGGLDYVDPTSIPSLPSISAATTGFITIYNPSSANLSALGSFLWSSMFDESTFKKLFVDPMDCIISLGIVPCVPSSGGARNIMFGNVDTGINCSYLATEFVQVDCGSVDVQKYIGSFMDYSPYVKINLFLPYIGFVHLGTDDIMGGSINVTYNVDVLSGDCIAFISHSAKGVLYSYSGNCRANIAVTAANYASALKNYYEAIAGIIPSTVNGAMSGGAAGAAAGAASGALSAAANIVLNSKPQFQRSGNIGGPAGILGVQTPFIIIERPNISVPYNVGHYEGQTSNITMSLGSCSGMTICEAVHLDGLNATTEEISEIEDLLMKGVIL